MCPADAWWNITYTDDKSAKKGKWKKNELYVVLRFLKIIFSREKSKFSFIFAETAESIRLKFFHKYVEHIGERVFCFSLKNAVSMKFGRLQNTHTLTLKIGSFESQIFQKEASDNFASMTTVGLLIEVYLSWEFH